MKLEGKTILVTGSSRGIGRAVAEAAAAEGASLILHFSRNVEAAEELRASLPGSGHSVIQADFARVEDAELLAKQILENQACPDVLVNNAGVFEEHPPLSASFEDWKHRWDETLAVNLSAPAHLSYFFGRAMAERGGGRIVNVSSRGAFRGEPEAPAYGASKAGMNAMGQSMAKALAPAGVLVFTVAPGFVETDMAGDFLNSPEGDAVRAQSPLNRVATPEEIASAVVFLAGDAPAYMTGAILDVNGASYLRS
jgi:3-oxoacyl-[acyl-carrier protein] reductase